MTNLIPVSYENDQPTVSGRELHKFLEVNSNYTTWFKRMTEYGFAEGTDYKAIFQKWNTAQGNETTQTDHQLTINMAKELCMIQRNAKGREARQYFLKVEAAWNSPEAVMARALKFADREVLRLKDANAALLEENTRMKPKEVFADAVSTSNASILIGELAKILRQNGVEIGQNRLFEELRKRGYLISREGTDRNMPSQYSMERGWFAIKETAITHSDGHTSVNKTTKVTGKGQQYFINLFLKEKRNNDA